MGRYSQEERIIMKTSIFVFLTLFSIISIGESCLNPCSGVTAATCTSPCFKCGLCSEHCCQTIFGRDETDRVILPCLSGRNDTNSSDLNVDIEFIEKKAFEVCDTDDDGGLSWPEVKICEDMYGKFLKIDHLPNEDDFDKFDSDSNGVLFFEEWQKSFA